ncbi:hypothetical protein [Marinicella sp. W31]|uniref:hypothetical protein n=1 Tax=Marinicella sp. W31 TaxID=3023713 RepID=UPI00375835E0
MKTWREKFQNAKPYQVKELHTDFAGMKRGQMMLLPDAQVIDAYIRGLDFGYTEDIKTMRTKLAKKHQAEVSCPVVTGIQLRVVAEAAFEAFQSGSSIDEITPVWRVIDEKVPLLKKITFDPQFILEQRTREQQA